jgi:protein gp37
MTTIEWTRNPDGSKGKSWNPIRAYRWTVKDGQRVRVRGWHCEHVHEGCKLCYAEGQNKTQARGGTGLAYKPGNRAKVEIELDEATLRAPLKWRKPTRIFVCSMTDLFGAWVSDEWLDKIVAVAALCPQHTFIILTKRPARQRAYFEEMQRCYHGSDADFARRWGQAAADVTDSPCAAGAIEDVDFPLPNVWLLTSCSEQKDADQFVPEILRTPAAVRGVSLEPMLAPIDLKAIRYRDEDCDVRWNALTAEAWIENSDSASAYSNESDGVTKLDWVIVGGESGKKARPLHPDWVRDVRDDCHESGTAFFFKQWGIWTPGENVERTRGIVATADWFGEKWFFDRENLANTDGHIDDEPDLYRVGKKQAGRHLDGVEHNGMPGVLS